MDRLYTKHSRGSHQAFTPAHELITRSLPTEIELVQALQRKGIDVKDYAFSLQRLY